MGEFDDLFKDYENKNTVSTTQNQEPMGNSAVKNEVNRQAKRNRTMFLLYIVVTLVVSITTTVILNNKYDGITGTIRNLDIVGEISVITTPSTDDDFPFEYRMTGSIKNLNNYLLPIVYVEYTFYDDNEKVLGTYYIEKTALGPQETFTFDETALFETDFVSSDYDYGFDESPFFYLFVSLLAGCHGRPSIHFYRSPRLSHRWQRVLQKIWKIFERSTFGFLPRLDSVGPIANVHGVCAWSNSLI